MLMNFIADAIKGGGKKADPDKKIHALGKWGMTAVGPEKQKAQQRPGGKVKQFVGKQKRRNQVGKRS